MSVFLVGSVVLLLPNEANAQKQRNAVQTALDLCANLPDDINKARTVLSEANWQESDKAKFTTLFWITAAARFDARDIEYTFSNAAFLAASVLGNSALGSDQIGVEFEDYRLAVLGIPENTPYCVMTGPEDLPNTLFSALGNFGEEMAQASSTLIQTVGTLDGKHRVMIGTFNLEELESMIQKSPLAEDYKAELQPLLTPTVIHIANLEDLQ